MRLKNVPPPRYTFRYRSPPESGNAINGLGAGEAIRPRKVYHGVLGAPPLAWQALNTNSASLISWGAMWQRLRNRWQLRRAQGPLARRAREVGDPSAMAGRIKELATQKGAGIVGIAAMGEDVLYADSVLYGDPGKYKYAICIGRPMRRAEMLDVPGDRSQTEVQRSYRQVSRVAIEVAVAIRAMGWPARAFGDSKITDILHHPLAIRAGLGQLGKHGSLISREFGSNFRLSTVLTDLPLAIDQAVDIAVDDLCFSCRRCTIDCPPDAISDAKQRVRGVDKWYVDFDKCIPYFAMTRGCGICIEVCPWSEPGRGPELSDKLMARRNRAG